MSAKEDDFKDITTSRGLVQIGSRKFWTIITILTGGIAASGLLIYWIKIHHHGFPENENLLKVKLKQALENAGMSVKSVNQGLAGIEHPFGTATEAEVQLSTEGGSSEAASGRLLSVVKTFLASLATRSEEE